MPPNSPGKPRIERMAPITDKATGELVKNFRCVPGSRGRLELGPGEWWEQEDAYASKDGAYKITRGLHAPTHMVRIEAAGYKVAVSRDIKSDEGEVELNFELIRAADVTINIKTPDGEPASEAEVAIGLANEQIMTRNGEFTTQTYATRLKTNKAGVLKTPFRDQPFEIYILHPTGFSHVKSGDGALPDQLTLTAWASVRGTIFSANKPAPNVPVSLYTFGSFRSELCSVSVGSQTESDDNGLFIMPRVFPGTGRIGRHMVYMHDEGAAEVISSKQVRATFVAGETTTVEVGRGGRPVVGRLLLPPDFQMPIVWAKLRLQLDPDLPQPIPLGLDQDDPQAFAKWQQTQEARDYEIAIHARQTQMDELPVFHASVDRGGTFRIDNVPAGKFVLSEWSALRDWKLSLKPQSLEIPEFTGDYEETPLNLHEIELVPQ